MPPPSNSRASSYHPNTENTIRNIGTSGHGDATSSTIGRSVTDEINVTDLLECDDSPELQMPPDITGSDTIELERNAKKYLDVAVNNSSGRGRVVVVRLHQTVEFTPDAFATRVFRGNVQEFQFHPDRSTTVVIFFCTPVRPDHPFLTISMYVRMELHKRLKHCRWKSLGIGKFIAANVRKLLRTMPYRAKDKRSCLPPQIKPIKCHVGLEATRATKIHHIPSSKTLIEVRHELDEAPRRMMVRVQLFNPDMPHLYDVEGKTCIINFSTLIDAIEAYDLFKNDDA